MKITKFIKNIHYKISHEEKIKIQHKIIEQSKPTGSYYFLICLSALIATFGLMENSTAVVIGAMLVAPLMGPIFGIALSITIGNKQLLKYAVLTELAGIILAIALPALIGIIPIHPDFGSEILARTQPTVYDVLIALASGFAGAYALINEKISPALSGVAISTALVPPLAVCGLYVASGNWVLSGGAFLLFTVNFIAIEFAATFMFVLFGLVEIPRVDSGSRMKNIVRKLGVSFIILFMAAIFMTGTLINLIEGSRLKNQIRDVLTEQLSAYAGARLSDIKYTETDNSLEVRAVVITPKEFASDKVADMEKNLQINVNADTHLIVSSVISKDLDRNGPVFISADEKNNLTLASKEIEFMNKVSLVVSSEIKSFSGAQLSDISKDTGENGTVLITASIRTPQTFTPKQVMQIQSRLNENVDSSIKLTVKSIITKDTDSSHYITGSTIFAESLTGDELDLYNNILNESKNYFSNSGEFKGVTLSDLNFEHINDQINVYITATTPVTLGPQVVQELQSNLRTKVDNRIKLTVKSVVGGTATVDGYSETDMDASR